MKKILIALALIVSVNFANAQVKSVADSKKSLESAIETSQNPKKAAKPATWIKLGKAYVAVYDAPAGNVWAGASRQELSIVMGSEKPTSVEEVVVNNQPMLKETYADKVLYFNGSGQLMIIDVTNPIDKDALSHAVDAYKKAYELDASKSAKDVKEAFKSIAEKYSQEAYNKYQLGDFSAASVAFENAAKTAGEAPLSELDTNSLYNAGFTAWTAGEKERAKTFFETCYANGYYAADGEVFSKLADVDTTKAKAYLEEGFEKFPQSQSILIGLINYYLKNNENPDRLFALLDKAKQNEPNNASLYYVEGNIHTELGNEEKAIAAYRKCAEIDPNYVFGYIGEGIMYYNKAIELQTKAQEELDDKKYQALVEEFEAKLKSCIEPFEKAYSITKDESIKVSIAEYLKNAYYRFREQSPEYQAAYDKYSNVVSSGKAE